MRHRLRDPISHRAVYARNDKLMRVIHGGMWTLALFAFIIAASLIAIALDDGFPGPVGSVSPSGFNGQEY